MSKRTLAVVPDIVRSLLPSPATGRLLVALSGGLDSTVLLRLLSEHFPGRIRAVHIHHGLHPNADAWERACERTACSLGIEFLSQRVELSNEREEGTEAAARRARYAVFDALLRPGEALVTAHHADDQLETVLLALMRGSGVDGLSAMPAVKPFGAGWHLRPLLEFTRDELLQWAHAHGLDWIDDPSNANARFDRNYLRAHVLPVLRARWPSAAQSAARTASHCGEAAQLLDEVAASDLANASSESALRVSALRTMEGVRRRNLLRFWLASHGARMPSTRKLAGLEHDMLAAHGDRQPCVAWDGVEVRRHRDFLYCMRGFIEDVALSLEWDWMRPLALPDPLGTLRAEFAHGRGLRRDALPSQLHVRSRVGGERLRLSGHAHHRDLKKLLQEANVLPWWRERLPLVFAGDRLIAVADLWLESDYAARADESGVRLVWEERPKIYGVAQPNPAIRD